MIWKCAIVAGQDVKSHQMPGLSHCKRQKRKKEQRVCTSFGIVLAGWSCSCFASRALRLFFSDSIGAGGNAGGQSTVLVVRRLALATHATFRSKKTDKVDALSFRRIIIPEILVGAKLAVVLFGAAFLRCAIFKVYGAECMAICLSMLVIVFTSTALGAALPLFLSQLGVDPAHAGATIQVLMDVSGVALTCVISSAVLGFQGTANVQKSTSVTTSPAATLHGLQVGSRHSSSFGTAGQP